MYPRITPCRPMLKIHPSYIDIKTRFLMIHYTIYERIYDVHLNKLVGKFQGKTCTVVDLINAMCLNKAPLLVLYAMWLLLQHRSANKNSWRIISISHFPHFRSQINSDNWSSTVFKWANDFISFFFPYNLNKKSEIINSKSGAKLSCRVPHRLTFRTTQAFLLT